MDIESQGLRCCSFIGGDILHRLHQGVLGQKAVWKCFKYTFFLYDDDDDG